MPAWQQWVYIELLLLPVQKYLVKEVNGNQSRFHPGIHIEQCICLAESASRPLVGFCELNDTIIKELIILLSI